MKLSNRDLVLDDGKGENHQRLRWTRTSKTAGNVDCVREPRLHSAGEINNANGSGTRIAESQRPSWSTAERKVASSQLSSTRVLRPWHSATTWDREEPEDVSMLPPSWACQGGRDTRAFGKEHHLREGLTFFCFFACFLVLLLTLLGTVCLQQETVKQRYLKMIWSIFHMPSLTPASLKPIKEVRSSLRGSFFRFFFFFLLD